MSDIDAYKKFCHQRNDLSIFIRPWWLDASCGESGWNVSLCIKNDEIVGALPYRLGRKWGMNHLLMPPLTPFLGPWITLNSQKESERFTEERDILISLVNNLPEVTKSFHRLHPGTGNALPFYWNGYSLSTAYTYQIVDLHDLDTIWAGFRSSARREIRKAESRFNLTVNASDSFEDFYSIYMKTFHRQSLEPKIPLSIFRSVHDACKREDASTILTAQDPAGVIHAVMYLLHDSQSTYYLAGGGDPGLRNSGAASLIVWEALRLAATKSQKFDFEGSIILVK